MDISDDELMNRTHKLIDQYTTLAPEVADKMEQFGRLRKELTILVNEIKKRGIEIDAP